MEGRVGILVQRMKVFEFQVFWSKGERPERISPRDSISCKIVHASLDSLDDKYKDLGELKLCTAPGFGRGDGKVLKKSQFGSASVFVGRKHVRTLLSRSSRRLSRSWTAPPSSATEPLRLQLGQ